MKKDSMNKFLVIKDILAICGPYFSEETRNNWMNDLLDRGNDYLNDMYPISKHGLENNAATQVFTTSTTSSTKEDESNSNERETPSIKPAVLKEANQVPSNKSSSSSSSSSSNVVSQSHSQASREVNPRYGPSSSAQSTDFTSAIQTSQMTIKTATTVKNITDKPNHIPLIPGSAHRIFNADLEIEEDIPKGRQKLKGIMIANHILNFTL